MDAPLPIVLAMAAFLFGKGEPRAEADTELSAREIVTPQVEQAAPTQLAQAPAPPGIAPSDADKILRAIEGLRQENQEQRERLDRLERATAAPPATPSRPAPTRGMTNFTGWVVELFKWNADMDIQGVPLATLYMPNERFNGALGHPVERARQFFIYRFRSTLRITQPGNYVLNSDLRCQMFHACHFKLRVGNSEVITIAQSRIDRPEQRTIALDAIEYPIEIVFAWRGGGDLSYRTDGFSFLLSFKGQADQSLRPFKTGELVASRPIGTVTGNITVGAQ